MDQDLIGYHNGEYKRASEIHVSPWDLGFLRGYGVFDVLPVLNGRAFLWEWHYERLERSAEMIGLHLPITKEVFGETLRELIVKNSEWTICFRTVLTGGVSQDAFTPLAGQETLLILTELLQAVPTEIMEGGATVMTLDHVRTFPQVKMTHYVSAIQTLPKRKSMQALETLYVQNGVISECAQSNFFIVKNGVVITTSENALLGITQKLILEKLAPDNQIPIEVRTILLEEVLTADEAFLTGSNKGVVPIVKIDEYKIGDGTPGAVTQKLMQLYREFLQRT